MRLRDGFRPMLRAVERVVRPIARELRRVVRGIPAVGKVEFGHLRRTRPISVYYGLDRGQPIDRVYIERFLDAHRLEIRGAVLEIGGSEYTHQFGGARVTHSEVLDIKATNPAATVIADLTSAAHLEGGRYDAIILTQVLQSIFDVPAAIETLHRLLRPGGVLLVSVCGVSSVGRACGDDASWCWSFTPLSLQRLLAAQFGGRNVETKSHGNVLTAVTFLHGLAASELNPDEFVSDDSDYPVVVTARAVKVSGGG